MSEYNPIELLQCLPREKRGEVRRWMTACGVEESALTVPLVALLASASELDDEGMKRVIAAMVEQEVPVAMVDQEVPAAMADQEVPAA